MGNATTLITGATGFIGRRLMRTGDRALVRIAGSLPGSTNGDLLDRASLRMACEGIDCIFHCAGYAHAFSTSDADAHWRINFEGTRNLLTEAGEASVRRFVFLSSVKAMAEPGDGCVDEDWPGEPATPYGRAKRAAEDAVLEAGAKYGMHVAVLRLPLVYGPGNKGNIPRMIAAIDRGQFPPFPKIENKRSMVYVDDAVQALLLAAEKHTANGQVYIVTDGCVYSTYEIYVAICRALGRPVPRWSVPAWILRAGAKAGDALESITGLRAPLTSDALEKLFSSAWYNSDKIRRELEFIPHHTFFDALPEMIASYRAEFSVRSTAHHDG